MTVPDAGGGNDLSGKLQFCRVSVAPSFIMGEHWPEEELLHMMSVHDRVCTL